MIDPEIGYFANDGVSKKNLASRIYQVHGMNTTTTANLVSGSSNDVHMEPHQENQTENNKPRNVVKEWIIGFARFVSLLVLLYVFICSLTFLTDAFRLIAGKSAGDIFAENEVLTNPIVGLMIGVLFTVLVQSSSTCTTVIVSLVSSDVIDVRTAIPMVMGANIGTSMTSTLVSLTHATDAKQFERAFSAATVHDCFNWLAVIVLLIIEVSTGYLFYATEFITQNINITSSSGGGKVNLLKAITKPLTKQVVQIDKHVLECWSLNNCQSDPRIELYENKTRLLKIFCKPADENGTHADDDYCHFLFNLPHLTDMVIGVILLVISLTMLSLCLLLIVKVLRSALQGSMAIILRKFINADIPKVPWLTGYLAIIVGALMTFVVQSSSVFTSTITPLVGVGLITVERVYPLTLGSNIGTTTTALLAALAEGKRSSLQIALCHLIFNITAILIFYPIPFMRWPLGMCKVLGRTTARYRWFAIFYLFVMFFILPGTIMGLSLAGNAVLFGILGPLFIILAVTIVINILQTKKPDWLPSILKNWNYLPLWMHSLEPLDKMLRRVGSACCCCCSWRLKGLSAESTLESIKTSTETIANSDSNPRQFCDLGQINYALEVETR